MRLQKKGKNKKPKRGNAGNFKKYFINSAYAAAAVLITAATFYAGYKTYNYLFYIKKVFVLKSAVVTGKGLTHEEKEGIIKQSGLVRNENLIGVDLKRVSRLIASDRWIEDVTVYKKYPDKIVIFVKKRKVFAMAAGSGGLYYIGKNGYAIGKAGYNAGYDYPVITGLRVGNTKSYFNGLKKALDFLKAVKSSVISGRISEVHMEKDGGIAVYTDAGLSIKFGTGHYDEKLKTLKKLFYEIKTLHINYKPYINLEYKNEAVINVNPGSRVMPANYKNTAVPSDAFK